MPTPACSTASACGSGSTARSTSSQDALPQLVADYVHPGDLVADGHPEETLLDAIRRFHRESLAGEYYQEFAVNLRNVSVQRIASLTR